MKDKFILLIDDSLLNLFQEQDEQDQNKHLLSFLNDFESGDWRYAHFNNFIFDNLCEAGLSAEERVKLAVNPYSAMVKAAKNLRFSQDNGQGSELAEILLYGIMRHHYGALPVVPKIYYKQNTQDNAKGADSVHIVLEEDGRFSLWYGETKFYNNLVSAMNSAISSVKDAITDSKLRKDNGIVTSMKDLEILVEDKEQLEKIKAMLSSNMSLDTLKPILHIPILLLHECEVTAQQKQMLQTYSDSMREEYQSAAKTFFEKLNKECTDVHLYSQIRFHLILFPVPSKENVVQRFIEQVKAFRLN